jgi:predicted nucleotidyltransferase
MRLTPQEADRIRETAEAHFGPGTVVRLFGSRADDTRRGGDIDLHIIAGDPDRVSLEGEISFRVALEGAIGEQRVDLILRRPAEPDRAMDHIAKQTGTTL